MKSFGLTDRGAVRRNNQDCFLIEKCEPADCLIAVLCDGMGGARAGGLASQLANKAFVANVYESMLGPANRRFDYRKMLTAACENANGVAYEYSHFSEEYEGMGTTLVGGVIKNNGNGYIINVGDSRAYQYSRRDNSFRQITKDHSLVGELVEMGVLTREQAQKHPNRNVITRALGSEPGIAVDFFDFRLLMGDVLLLCSDGLYGMVGDEEMLECIRREKQPEPICRALMDLALERGAKDNVTVLAVSR